MNFKVRVVENVGHWRKSAFGEKGTVHRVTNGAFVDREGFYWDNESNLFANIDQLNDYFYDVKNELKTKFELVKEIKDIKTLNKSSLIENCIVETVDETLYKYEIRKNYGVETRAFYCINGKSFMELREYNGRLEHEELPYKNIIKVYSPLKLEIERNILSELEQLIEESKLSNYTEEDIRTRLKLITG